ncbi:hypothetical protein [uncultured Clostridium sp.]|uniref:hypothetical protein n=1 Tax=uncultured Clostridium sp. TaxID=59620 RepID=UPI002602734F|nr:hypothetical protein [uncultured Clostridium sp.]
MIDLEKIKAVAGEMARPSRENSFDRLEFTKVRADMKGYKLFCPAGQTQARLKILHNEQVGLPFRSIVKHEFTHTIVNGKRFRANPPCLKQYGTECPVCSVSKNIVEVKGKEILKDCLKYKQKYISFAYIEEITGHPETDPQKKINPGDVVLMLYPGTIFEKINQIISRCTTDADYKKFFSQNESISFLLSMNPSAAPSDMYSFMPDPMPGSNVSKIFSTPDGDVKFVEMLNSLPSLYDIYLPEAVTDEIISLNREVAEELSKRYLSNNTPDATTANLIEGEVKKQEALQQATTVNPIVNPVVNPVVVDQTQIQAQAQVVQQTVTPVQQNIPTTVQAPVQSTVTPNIPQAQPQVNVTTTAPASTVDSSKPECFGKYNDIDAKCLICPHSTECSTNK